MTKIKITARDSTTALDQVSKKLGADAYILSTNSHEDGVEIEATNDLMEVKKLTVPKKANFSGVMEKELGNVAKFPTRVPETHKNLIFPKSKLDELETFSRDDISGIKYNLEKIENQLKGMFLTDISGLSVELGQSSTIKLTQDNFDPQVIKMLRPSFEGLNYERGRKAFLKSIAEKLSTPYKNSKYSFIIGLSGVGKSTLVAKMAAYRNVKKSANNLVIASLDKEENNINESLRSFARMLNIPMIKLTAENISETLFAIKEDVIIDVSMDPVESLKIILDFEEFWGVDKIDTILAINGGANQNIIKKQASLFGKVKPSVAITKLDECEISAQEVSQYIISNLKISYLTGSRSIVDDLAISNKEILEQYFIENC
jgi:flagellar biosynthesis protein FlhF